MISSAKIQHEYNRMYKQIRKYIWDFSAVEALADLEVEVYRLCPDIYSIRDRLSNFRLFTREVEFEDEELQRAIDKFEDLINEDDTPFAKLWQTKEVIQ